jgi:TPR repeat protein
VRHGDDARGCDTGDGSACQRLADRALRGVDQAPDAARAFALLTRGCEHGHAPACTMLARLSLRGHGTEASPSAALASYARACKANDAEGCSALGELYEHGVGTAPDPARAFDLYQRAVRGFERRCRRRDAFACGELGALLRAGRGVVEDRARGLELERRACAAGQAAHCAAWMERGEHVVAPRDAAMARTLEDGCRAGVGRACRLIARVGTRHRWRLSWEEALSHGCRGGDGGSCNALGLARFPPNAAGKGTIERACQLGDALGCHHLAALFELPGDDQDPERAATLYERACHWDHGPACTRLGILAARGGAGELGAEAAASAFGQGCELGAADACYELGVMRHSGRGIDADAAAGERLLTAACDLGHAPACARLALVADRQGEGSPLSESALRERACESGEVGACRELLRTRPADATLVKALRGAADAARVRCDLGLGLCVEEPRAWRGGGSWIQVDGAWGLTLDRFVACGEELERVCNAAGDGLRADCTAQPEGCFAAADLYLRLATAGLGPGGEAIRALEREAAKGARRACDARNGPACRLLAQAYRTGRGVAADPAQAERFQKRTCQIDPNECGSIP